MLNSTFYLIADNDYYNNLSFMNSDFYYQNEMIDLTNEKFKFEPCLDEENESLFETKSPRNDFDDNNRYIEKKEEIYYNIDNKKTQATTLTGKKRERDIPNKNNNINILNPEENKIENDNNKNAKKVRQKNKGRYKKNEISDNINKHDKNAEDNLMRKIKTNIFLSILSLLNNSLNDKSNLFYKLDKKLNENLKKDFNEELMQKTIAEIYMNYDVCLRYKKAGQNLNNKNLIKKIYEENKEKNTIKILNMKYIDIVNDIKKYNMEIFLNKIKKEIKNSNINIDEYLNGIKSVFNRYEQWYNDKKGRNRSN